jgi:uncharacterized protein (TIGR03382 family)
MASNLDWTHTTALTSEQNFAQWDFFFAAAGTYDVQVYTSAAYAQSKQAKYKIMASGQAASKTIDQTAVDGWQSLGTFTFAQGGHQYVHVGDDTGEPGADNVQLVFDAVQLVPAGDGSGSGSGDPNGDPGGSDPTHTGGCSTGSGAGAGMLLALLALVRRRR